MRKWSIQVGIALVAGLIAMMAFTGSAKAADCTWKGGGADNKWSTAANWNGCEGGFPGAATDTASINLTGAAVSVDVDVDIAGFTLDKGTVTIAAGWSLRANSILMSGGTLTGAGDLAAPGFTWSGGTLAGTGKTTISSVLSLSNTLILTGRNLTLTGSGGTWTGAGGISGTGSFTINGAMTRSGTGTLTIAGITLNGNGTATFSAGTTTVNAAATYHLSGTTTVSGGTLNLAAATLTSLGETVNLSGGTLNLGTKNATISTLHWSDGTLAGGGTTTVSSALVLSGTLALNDRILINSGAGTWANDGALSGTGTASFHNANGGSFTKTGSGNATMSAVGFYNAGQLDVNGGELTVDLSSSVHSTGGYSVAAGSTLNFYGSHTFDSGAGFSGAGSITFHSGSVLLNGSYGLSGATILNGASTSVTLHAVPASSGGSFSVNDGKLIVNDGGTHRFTTGSSFSGNGVIEFQAGDYIFEGSYALSNGGNTRLQGADIDLSSAASVSFGSTLTISAGQLALGSAHLAAENLAWSGGVLRGAGSLTISGSLSLSGTALALNDSTLRLEAGAVGAWTGAGRLNGSGSAAFLIVGTFEKNGAGAASIEDTAFQTTGSVQVNGGTLSLSGLAGQTSLGSFTVANGALLEIAGAHTFGGTITAAGSGAVNFNAGAISVSGIVDIAGETRVAGAAVDFSTATLTSLGSTFRLTSGAVQFGSLNPGVFDFQWSGGSLSLTGDLQVNHSLALSDTLVFNGGSINVPVGASVTWSGGGAISGTGSLNVSGSFQKQGGGELAVSGIALRGGGGWNFSAGTTAISSVVEFSGTTALDGGTLDLSQAVVTSLGSPLTLSAGLLNLGTKDVALADFNWSGGTLSGAGMLQVNHQLALSGTLTLTGRTLYLPGSATGTWSGAGSLTGSGSLMVNGVFNRVGAGVLSLSGITLSGSGELRYSAGTTNFSGAYNRTGATIVDGGVFNVSAATLTSLGNPLTLSAGSLTLGNQIVNLPIFNWSGGTLAGSGTVQVNSGLTLGGNLSLNAEIIRVASTATASWSGLSSMTGNGTLTVDGGIQKAGPGEMVLSGINLSGVGEYRFSSGTTTLSGTMNVGGSITVDGGVLNLSTATLVNLGSTLVLSDGLLHLGAKNGQVPSFVWRGGSITGNGMLQVITSLVLSGSLMLDEATLVVANSASAEWADGGSLAGSGSLNMAGVFHRVGTGSLLISGITLTGGGTYYFDTAQTIVSGIYAVNGATVIDGGSLDLAAAALTSLGGSVQLSGGAVNLGANNVTIPNLAWSGGVMSGSAGVVVNTSLAFSNALLLEGLSLTLSHDGTALWSGAGRIEGSGTFVNDGIFTRSGSGDVTIAVIVSGTGTFNYAGGRTIYTATINGSGSTDIYGGTLDLSSAQMTNLGSSLSVSSGTLVTNAMGFTLPNFAWSGGSLTGSGDLQVSGSLSLSNALVLNGRTLTLLAGGAGIWHGGGSLIGNGSMVLHGSFTRSGAGDLSISGITLGGSGTINFEAGTTQISGGYDVSGSTRLSGGILDLSSSNLISLGSDLIVSSGTLLLGNRGVSLDLLNQSGGEIRGSNSIIVQTLQWTGGSMSGDGTTRVEFIWSISASVVIDHRTLINAGETILSGNSAITGSGALINQGLLIKGGTGTSSSISGVNFDNAAGARVLAESGTLAIDLSTNQPSRGTYEVDAGAVIIFNGSHTFAAGADLTGQGAIQFLSGHVILNNLLSLDAIAGATTINSADLDGSSGTVNSLGANATIVNGSINLGSASVDVKVLTLNSATLSGSGVLAVADQFTIDGESILNGLLLDHHGVGTLMGTAVQGTGTLQNSGTIVKMNSTGLEIRLASLINSGSFTVQQGGLLLASTNGSNTSGMYTVLGGASLVFNENHNFTSTSRIAGAGSVEFHAGEVKFLGNYQVTGASHFSGADVELEPAAVIINLGAQVRLTAGLLNLSSGVSPEPSGLLAVSGGILTGSDAWEVNHLVWSGGTLSGSGSTIISAGGILDLTGSGALTLDARRLENKATATWNRSGSDSALYLIGGPQILNSGSLTIENSGLYLFQGSGEFINQGSFNKNHSDALFLSGAVFRNEGSVHVNLGDLQIAFSPGSGSVGSYSVANGARMKFSGGHRFLGSSSINGAGTVEFSSGMVEVEGEYEVTGVTVVNGASLNLANSSLTQLGSTLHLNSGSLNYGAHQPDLTTINLAGGELQGSGRLSVATLNWNNGTMKGPGTTIVTGALHFNGTTSLILDQRLLENRGTADWNNSGFLYLLNDSVLTNAAGGVMNLNSTDSFIIYGAGTLENQGVLNFSQGEIQVTLFRQAAGATLNYVIQGLEPKQDFGQMNLVNADLDGILNINFSGYTPSQGNHFSLLSYSATTGAAFAEVHINDQLPAKPWEWQLKYTPTILELWSGLDIFIPLLIR